MPAGQMIRPMSVILLMMIAEFTVMGRNVYALNMEPLPKGGDPLSHRLPCGWISVSDPSHPERPRQIRPNSQRSICVISRQTPALVHVSEMVHMLSKEEGTLIVLSVEALEEGSQGQVIRCRSSIDGSTVLGRVVDSGTLSFIQNERKTSW